jgi:hypothetical protein
MFHRRSGMSKEHPPHRAVWMSTCSAPIRNLQFPVLGSAPSGRLGRGTALPQLKVDRLCSVVDSTAEFDPKRMSGSEPAGGSGDGLQLLPQPALSEVPSRCCQRVAGRPPGRSLARIYGIRPSNRRGFSHSQGPRDFLLMAVIPLQGFERLFYRTHGYSLGSPNGNLEDRPPKQFG